MTLEELAEIEKVLQDFDQHPKGQDNCSTMAFYAVETISALIAEIRRLQVLIAWAEDSMPGRQAARLYGCDGFELSPMLENAIKAGKGQLSAHTRESEE